MNLFQKILMIIDLKNFILIKEYFLKTLQKNLRILHVTNFNERLDGRLFFNTGRRINNGFIRLGHSVLGFRQRYSKVLQIFY